MLKRLIEEKLMSNKSNIYISNRFLGELLKTAYKIRNNTIRIIIRKTRN